jgi:hypothetical protein
MENNMNSRDVKIIIGVIVAVVIIVILYSLYERKDNDMGSMKKIQENSMIIASARLASSV